LLKELPCHSATDEESRLVNAAVRGVADHMGRSVDISGLRELLYQEADSPLWESVADRCMACANCTMVCPTCFCATVEDTTNLDGDTAERWRVWDSCFTMDFSYIHGGSLRKSGAARYRQWMTHKLAGWQDQFGAPGCVGCGRCITWCPAGIDITEELAALRTSAPH
jgi:formate hydrogenlyase subunit 6/NADH:ubiquinone oxidoreductase subunit I